MNLRRALSSVLVASLSCLTAAASQPKGVVGKLVSNPIVQIYEDSGLPYPLCSGFYWANPIGPHTLDPADTLTLDMAIIPFRAGATEILLGGSRIFVRLVFRDGLVDGVAYDRSGWNDVTVQMHPATQDYVVTVNGVQGGPFPYQSDCQQEGGCFDVGLLAVRGGEFQDSQFAWLDNLSLARSDSAGGGETLLQQGFELCSAPAGVALGGLVISDPPRNPRAMQR